MKKADAEDKLAKAGFTINNLNASAWNTALHPTRYGWGSSLLGIVSIPVLSAASLGHMVAAAVTSQVGDDTFEHHNAWRGRREEGGGRRREEGLADPSS